MPEQPPPPTRDQRRLIVSADDFGMSAGVNAAILAAHRNGILTDASLMVNAGASAEAVALAHGTPRLAVGLHLVLVHGRSSAASHDIPDLVDRGGMFRNHSVAAGMRYFFLPRVRAQLETEIRAQLENFLATGLSLSHVDGHLNIHMHPTVLAILLRLARPYGIHAIRLPREPWRLSLRLDRRERRRKLVEAAIFAALSRYAAPRLAAHGIRHPDQIFGLHQSGHLDERYWLGVLAALPAGVTEIYSHPAHLDADVRRWRPPSYEAEAELAALTSDRVREALAAAGIARASYRDLARSPGPPTF
ncbi:MAG: hopanoid biosynthesis-associated protein HpnK [Candidatus Binatia bacterium]